MDAGASASGTGAANGAKDAPVAATGRPTGPRAPSLWPTRTPVRTARASSCLTRASHKLTRTRASQTHASVWLARARTSLTRARASQTHTSVWLARARTSLTRARASQTHTSVWLARARTSLTRARASQTHTSVWLARACSGRPTTHSTQARSQSDRGSVTHRSPRDRSSELNEPLAPRTALRLPTRLRPAGWRSDDPRGGGRLRQPDRLQLAPFYDRRHGAVHDLDGAEIRPQRARRAPGVRVEQRRQHRPHHGRHGGRKGRGRGASGVRAVDGGLRRRGDERPRRGLLPDRRERGHLVGPDR